MEITRSSVIVGAVILGLFTLISDSVGSKSSKIKETHVCKNYTITADEFAQLNYEEIQTDIVTRYWNQNSESLSEIAQRWADAVICHVANTDSHCLRYLLFRHAALCAPIMSNMDLQPDLSYYTTYLNESLIYYHTKDNCHELANALIKTGTQIFTLIQFLEYSILSDMGCKERDAPMFINTKTYKRGMAYDIEGLLKAFGKSLPCNLQQILLELYESKEYSDRMIALLFFSVLPKSISIVWDNHPQNLIVESLNIAMEEHKSKHCCHSRTLRLDELAKAHSKAAIENSLKAAKLITDEDYEDTHEDLKNA